jgi:hypothetical protein
MKTLVTSSMLSIFSPQIFLFSILSKWWGFCEKETKPSSSALKAGEKELPHLPLGKLSQV